MGTAARRYAPPPDIGALRDTLRDARTTLRAVRAGPCPDDAAVAALESLAASIEETLFALTAAAAEEAGSSAELYAEGFAAGRAARSRVPRQRADRHGLRCVPGEGKTRALGTVAAMALLVLLVPHHAVRAAGASPAVAVASRPWRVPLSADRPKSAARARRRAVPGRDRP